MAAPAGYVPLDLVGFTDKGAYVSESTYAANDIVHNDNKMYRSLQDNNTGHALPVSPETETEWWELWLSGGAEDLEAITVKDTSNVTGGGAGKVVVAQTLIDAIAQKVMNDLVAKSMIDNNLLGTDATHVLASPQGKALDEKITQLYSNLIPTKRNLTWQDTVAEFGLSYSLKFKTFVYVHAAFTTVSGLSAGNDLAMLIGSGTMQHINNIAAFSNQGTEGTFQVSDTNLQAGGTVPSGQTFVLDLIIPLQS